MDLIVYFLKNDEKNQVPIGSNSLSIFGKKIKKSFLGSTILNVFRYNLLIEKLHSIDWIELMIQKQVVRVLSGSSEKWSSNSIYTWSISPNTSLPNFQECEKEFGICGKKNKYLKKKK